MSAEVRIVAERPTPGTPRPYEFPAVARTRLPNGLTVAVVDLPGRPLVSGTLVVTDSGWTQTTIVLYKTGGNPNGDTLSVSGSWEVIGSNVTLFEGATTTYTGTFTSTSMTLTTKTATVLGYTK